MSIPGFDAWLDSAQGRHVLAWEQHLLDEALADIFGFNALQIGLPQYDFLRTNRIPLRQTGTKQEQADDHSPLPDPDRIVAKVLHPIAKMAQIKAEMENRHPDHGAAAQGVHGVKTHRCHGQGRGIKGVFHSDQTSEDKTP